MYKRSTLVGYSCAVTRTLTQGRSDGHKLESREKQKINPAENMATAEANNQKLERLQEI
jgi:hypothetical protein